MVVFQAIAERVSSKNETAVILRLVVVLQGSLRRQAVGAQTVASHRDVVLRALGGCRELKPGEILAHNLVVEIDRAKPERVREHAGRSVEPRYQRVGLIFILER